MNHPPSALWDEMLDEFRALGGVADNIRLGTGAFGRGVFPVDPSRPVKIHIPESLLVDLKDVEFVHGAFRIMSRSKLGRREKSFIENYQRDFSWGVGREHTETLLQMMYEAPAELREPLRKFKVQWLAKPSPEAIAERFFGSRVFRYGDYDVVMPIVELVNHGDAPGYSAPNGIGVSGQFSGEVFVRYRITDAWHMFANFGFASASENLALSIGLRRPELLVGTDDIKEVDSKKPYFPKVSLKDGQLKLSYLMLGNSKFHRLSRSVFLRIMQDAGRPNANELFDMIQHQNRLEFYNLLEMSELAAPPLGKLLRAAIRSQLKVLSYSIGTRDV